MGEYRNGRNPWIRIFHPGPEGARQVVCFPHGGGSASYYRPLSEALSRDANTLVAQYPGREDRISEEQPRTMAELADAAYAALRPELSERPVFFGHSMGAIVAFEVARRMARDTGRPPERLIVSACAAPSRRTDAGLRFLDDDALLAEVMALGGTDAGLGGHPELLWLVLPVMRNDFAVVETYEAGAGAVVDCPVSVILPDGDPRVTRITAEAWREHTTAGAEVRVVEGGHFYLATHPRLFLEHMQRILGIAPVESEAI
ncbi:thioesterase II family protein [Streptomyces roseolus]|uniref:thioesterase II family protein n=1 Tax=Streptomyces roseolus TaxID=67358 RepID=UPI001675FA17|nr:alpha/beta fold hydrolase [Streptomyces roseolus]GGR24048.1 thioesterase [Streptomyces roseolus]